MAKKPTAHKKITPATPTLTIESPGDGAQVPSPVGANGSVSPDGEVSGTLTCTATGATIQSQGGPAQSALGGWVLDFGDVPPGFYVLAVNAVDTSSAADAVNIEVQAVGLPVALVGAPVIQPDTGSTVQAMVTVNSPAIIPVSGVIIGSKPKHGEPKRQAGGPNKTITFRKLQPGQNFTLVIYPLRQHGKALVTTIST